MKALVRAWLRSGARTVLVVQGEELGRPLPFWEKLVWKAGGLSGGMDGSRPASQGPCPEPRTLAAEGC